ncbi:aldolase [Pseudomaricurvus alkylphenolicus]|uniref:HpcH/HpaI aldolase family protein n=1 Tax=Pseudomaricurvus alkylphenolicus TaxID=1306991 RepID=UPI00142121A4|nr:aldolase/citrate lyase family protein [Pseudomaricurvus alkylphenolicus]NIB40349.1 aldolase [Pseudomaricurvus alkylphenolicus]
MADAPVPTQDATSAAIQFRQRLLKGEPLIGTFLKTPSAIVCEVLAMTPLDAICLDAEHAPFGRLELDACLMAMRAAGKPSLVRVPSSEESQLLNALDCGASGVVIPHVCCADQAEALSRAARFGRGGRGYAGSTRAAGYTTKSMKSHLADSAAATSVIAQIEDVEAVDAIEEIAAVDGIDCLFVGRIDLTVALGAETPNDAVVVEAVERICAVGKAAGKSVGMFVPRVEDCAQWRERGANLFLLASDHSFMLQGANRLVEEFAKG